VVTIVSSTPHRARRALCALACAAALVSALGPARADDAAAAARDPAQFAANHGAATVDELTRELAARAGELTSAETASLLNDLGNAYMSLDEPLRGLAAFADARRLAPPRTPLGVIAGVNVARALQDNGVDQGLPARLAALDSAARALDPSATQARIFLSLAELYRDAYAREPLRGELMRGAAGLAEAALAFAESDDDALLLGEAHGALGLARAAQGSLDDALAQTRKAVTLAQSAGANDSLYRWEWQAGGLLRSKGDVDAALASYSAAIESLGATQIATAQSRSGFAKNVLPLYEEYADLMLVRSRTLGPTAAEAALRDVQRTLEGLRVAEVRNYFENQCSVPEVFDARASGQQHVVVIYPLVFANRTEILVSSGDRLRQFTVASDRESMTNTILSLRRAIEDGDSGDAFLRPSQALYRLIIAPLEPMLEAEAATTLIIVPDGPLRTIPFAVLHDGSRFLVERYALGITPALSLVGAVRAQPITRVLLNGIIAPTQGFPGLPFVAEELASIGATFPSREYTDASFVTATLERELVEGGYSVVHMATHAQIESDYRRSFLLAHDDLITMDELEDTIGSQRFSDRPVDLLVLSACRTAVGDERAALGLAGVAVKAGARSALASLWAVNDESTALLVGEFYRELASGAGKAAALRGAQLALLNDARYSHPAYWAPFLMIGDWR
jgi:CHAT domain-containing protein